MAVLARTMAGKVKYLTLAQDMEPCIMTDTAGGELPRGKS